MRAFTEHLIYERDLDADGKSVAKSAALRDIGPLMAKVVGGGFQ